MQDIKFKIYIRKNRLHKERRDNKNLEIGEKEQ